MELSNLIKIKAKFRKRIGRGLGSGKGKTGGRGMKGQKARGKVPASLIGGALALYKKLPMRRGQGRGKRRIPQNTVPVNLTRLMIFKAHSIIDEETLVKNNIVSPSDIKNHGVKILSKGEVQAPLTIKLPISKKAAEKILKAGGKVV